MPSSYVNNLRLEEMATGEKSGTWGTITNTNLELIGEALGYGTEDLASDADATITMQDATSDGVRAMYLKITSSVSLTTTRTITIAPNTVSKVWIIENATTGGQSITISQGSGANVTVVNSATKIIYTDGAGAGAAVTDALTDIDFPSFNVNGTAVTATAAELNYNDVTTLGTVEASKTVTADANADVKWGDSDKAIFGAGSDLEIYHDGSNSIINDAGTGDLQLQVGGSNKIEVTGTGATVTGTLAADTLTLTNDLAVAHGGTGASSFTANNVLLGNSTSSFQEVAPGTSGNVLTSNGTTWTSAAVAASGFDSGTLMLFQQTAAPTGWTKQTTHNDKALRVVSGTAGSGGSVAFSTAMGTPSVDTSSLSAGSHTLTTAQMPSHNHTIPAYNSPSSGGPIGPLGGTGSGFTDSTNSTGGGGSHSHSISGSATATINVNYVDLIIASKD